MGHLLSKNGSRLRKKKHKLRKKKRRRRNCFLQGPCMLCFIVHGSSENLDDDHLENSATRLAEQYTALSSPEDCAKFLLSPQELTIWEGQGKSLLSAVPAKLIGPQVLFRTAVPTPAPGDYIEMVCKRKCGEPRRPGPCKQPRCAFQESVENGGAGDVGTASMHCHLPLCPLPSSSVSSSSSSASSSEDTCSGGLHAKVGQSVGDTDNTMTLPQSSTSASCCQHACGDTPGDCRALEVSDAPSINQLPSSILLKVGAEHCSQCSWVTILDLSLNYTVETELKESHFVTRHSVNMFELEVNQHVITVLLQFSDTRNNWGFLCFNSLVQLVPYEYCPGCSAALRLVTGTLARARVQHHTKTLESQLCVNRALTHVGQVCMDHTAFGGILLDKDGKKLRFWFRGQNLVTDKSVRAFAEHCPELQFVGFMGCSVTSQGVIHLTGLKHLSSLDLRHISELSNETVMEVVRNCRSLRSLNLCLNWSISDRCVEIIAKEGRSLKELYLVSCKITDYDPPGCPDKRDTVSAMVVTLSREDDDGLHLSASPSVADELGHSCCHFNCLRMNFHVTHGASRSTTGCGTPPKTIRDEERWERAPSRSRTAADSGRTRCFVRGERLHVSIQSFVE
ncbi:F-box/LRR-repeat protein 17 [Arapaima gigas]